ncbi:MAG: hypothetical protein HY901_37380 [Deltaproteobacteria bacterium]|nr:hypothetical protein [Deltaproteobacteria bacterium]
MARANLTQSLAARRLLWLEALGFLLVILAMWADEVFDVPALLGGQATPVNWLEGILETVLVSVLGLITVALSARLLRRVRQLEGLISVCSICKRIHAEDQSWVPLETYVRERSDADFTHGLCPDCIRSHYPSVAARVLKRPAS